MIQDKAIAPSANIRLNSIGPVPITTATSQSAVLAFAIAPGYRFRVHQVDVFATAVTATITCDVQIGSTSVLSTAITPVAGSSVTANPASGLVAQQTRTAADAAQTLNVRYTTDGTGAATNLRVTVWIRPFPMNGEA